MLVVTIQRFEDLTEAEQLGASNNGHGKECATYIRVIHNGNTILLESDAMEPEDATFHRDLSWVPDLIRKCFEFGRAD